MIRRISLISAFCILIQLLAFTTTNCGSDKGDCKNLPSDEVRNNIISYCTCHQKDGKEFSSHPLNTKKDICKEKDEIAELVEAAKMPPNSKLNKDVKNIILKWAQSVEKEKM